MSGYIGVTVADMMQAREARWQMQQALLNRYPDAVLVCLTMNVAGPVKTTREIERAFAWGMESIRAVLAPYPQAFTSDIHEKTGPEAVFAVSGDAKEIKQRLCALEDGCLMGRLLDIDVIASDGRKISRTDVGLPARRCLLCAEAAPVCARSRAHTVEALFARTHEIIREHFEGEFVRRTAQMAQHALLTEAAAAPKPGLVDRLNAGAHADMDLFTFIDSACALRDYFSVCARTGLSYRGGDAAACFDALRVPGLLAERDMNAATGGVNTHKGAVFSLGVCCAALGMGYDGERSDPVQALARCSDMTAARMAREMDRIKNAKPQTFGEEIYKQARIGGVRAEAAGGYLSVREKALPRLRACLEAGLSLNDAALCTLIALMACTQDTNALRRGGKEAARMLRETAQELDEQIEDALACGGMLRRVRALHSRMATWDGMLSEEGVSPGGCADLLALTLLAHFMEKD